MSIWSFDLGIDPTWPEWFREYRARRDAELREKIQAQLRGDMSMDDFKAWALEAANAVGQWRASLTPEQRAWLEAEEADEELTPVAQPDSSRKLDLEKLLRELGPRR